MQPPQPLQLPQSLQVQILPIPMNTRHKMSIQNIREGDEEEDEEAEDEKGGDAEGGN